MCFSLFLSLTHPLFGCFFYSAQNHLNLSKFLNKNIYIYLFLLNSNNPESEEHSEARRDGRIDAVMMK